MLRLLETQEEQNRRLLENKLAINGKIRRGINQIERGEGIPEDQLALVTRPFYRVNSARTQANGTGLGMAIVQRLVGRYRGALRLRNRTPGPGLEVTIEFPLAKGA